MNVDYVLIHLMSRRLDSSPAPRAWTRIYTSLHWVADGDRLRGSDEHKLWSGPPQQQKPDPKRCSIFVNRIIRIHGVNVHVFGCSRLVISYSSLMEGKCLCILLLLHFFLFVIRQTVQSLKYFWKWFNSDYYIIFDSIFDRSSKLYSQLTRDYILSWRWLCNNLSMNN